MFKAARLTPIACQLCMILSAWGIGLMPAQAINDPTQPKRSQTTFYKDNLVLNSLLVGNHRRIAVINRQSVTIGDSIGSLKVIDITATQVVLKKLDQIVILKPRDINIRQGH